MNDVQHDARCVVSQAGAKSSSQPGVIPQLAVDWMPCSMVATTPDILRKQAPQVSK